MEYTVSAAGLAKLVHDLQLKTPGNISIAFVEARNWNKGRHQLFRVFLTDSQLFVLRRVVSEDDIRSRYA